MPRTILLLTNRFPYVSGEEFLETEITYLANSVDVVLVAPVKLGGAQRPLPRNVKVITDLAERASRDGTVRKFVNAALLLIKSPDSVRFNVSYLKALLIAEYYANLTQELVPKIMRDHHLSAESTVCYCYWFSGLVTGLIRLKGTIAGLRVVTRAHGMDLYESRLSLPEFPFRKSIIGKVDAVFCVSAHGKKHLEHSFGTSNIFLARLGTRRPDALPVRHSHRVVIVSCSGIKRVKRLDRIVETLALLATRYPSAEFEWSHIGDGELLPEVLGRAESRLKDLRNLSYNFLGRMTNPEVFKFYETNFVDCFLNLSESEGLPVSIMEAISFGVPVVAPSVGGIAEIVTRDSGVLLSPNPLPVEAAEAIALVTLRSAGGRYRLGARSLWENRFDADRNYREFCVSLQKLFVCFD